MGDRRQGQCAAGGAGRLAAACAAAGAAGGRRRSGRRRARPLAQPAARARGRGPAPTAPSSGRDRSAIRSSSSVPNGKRAADDRPARAARPGPTECCWQPNDVITNAEGRDLHLRRSRRRIRTIASSSSRQDGKFIQAVRQARQRARASSTSRTRWRSTRRAACSSATAATTASQIFDQNRQVHRRLAAVQPAERPLHRSQRHALLGRLGVGLGEPGARRLEARHPHRQRQGRQGHRVHSRSAADQRTGSRQGNPRPALGHWVAEGVAVDAAGNIYGAEVGPRKVQKYVEEVGRGTSGQMKNRGECSMP